MAVFGATGGNPFGSRPNFFGRQHLTFDKGRAWTPEVERPEFRKDAKQIKHTQTLVLRKEKMIANVINSSANKNNAAIRQTELSVVYYRSRS